uniref:CLASP_N domain-containing protein n=1 Tax=Ascaris lumbricoides TaxID=6252 RepID=A0A0M3I053_ASCLU
MCTHKGSAITIATNSQLVDRIAMAIADDDVKIAHAALRTIQMFALLGPSFAKVGGVFKLCCSISVL